MQLLGRQLTVSPKIYHRDGPTYNTSSSRVPTGPMSTNECAASVRDKRNTGSPEKEVSVSMATAKEEPRLAKYGLGVVLPLLLSESQTADVSGQSNAGRARWRRGSLFLAAEVIEAR